MPEEVKYSIQEHGWLPGQHIGRDGWEGNYEWTTRIVMKFPGGSNATINAEILEATADWFAKKYQSKIRIITGEQTPYGDNDRAIYWTDYILVAAKERRNDQSESQG